MKTALLAFAFISLSVTPRLQMFIEAMLHDIRLARLTAVTIGEIAADCFTLNLGSDLAATAAALGVLLAAALLLHLSRGRTVPRAYWLWVSVNSAGMALLSPALWPVDPA